MPEWQRQTGLVQESARQVNDASVNSLCYSIRLALMRGGQLQIDQLTCQSFPLFGTDNFRCIVREVCQHRGTGVPPPLFRLAVLDLCSPLEFLQHPAKGSRRLVSKERDPAVSGTLIYESLHLRELARGHRGHRAFNGVSVYDSVDHIWARPPFCHSRMC